MRRQLLSFYSVVGAVGGLIGLISAAIWYNRGRSQAAGADYSGLVGLGPLVLGFFSLIVLILAIISMIALLSAANEELEE